MTPVDLTSPSAGTSPLGFSLSFVEGRGVLALRDRRAAGLGVCEHLELEIPDLKFPFDGSGGAGRFQHRRSRLRRARLRVPAAELAAFLAARPALRAAGVEVQDVRLRDGWAELGGTARRAGAAVTFTARAYLTPVGDRAVRVSLADVRVHGFLPWPAGLIGQALLAGCAAVDGALGPRVTGLADLEIDPLDEALFGVLPPAGWRLPDLSPARLVAVDVGAAGVTFDYAVGARASALLPPERFRAHEEGARRFAAVDQELASGSIEAGRRAYVAAVQRDGEHPYLVGRLLEILANTPGGHDSALDLATRTLTERPDSPAALLAQAAVLLARGQPAAAATHLARVSDLAAAARDELEALAAARAAADLLVGGEPARAAPLLERILSLRPDDAATADALTSCLQRTRRFGDLAQHIARRATRAAEAGATADQRRLLADLGTVLLERLGDPVGAAAALMRAAELGADDPGLWETLAQAREAAGDEAGFVSALARAADLWAAAGEAAREATARSRAAGRCEQRGDFEAAAREYRRVLELRADDVAAWRRLAAVEERRGHRDEAAAALTRALDLCDRPSEQLDLHRELGRVALQGGALDAAQAHVDAAARLDPLDAATRRLAVEVATARGVPADLDAALARAAEVAAPPDRAELLTRRGLLLWRELGRPADALVALENAVAAVPTGAAAALRALCDLHEARGDEEGLRDALSRLLLVATDAPDLAELTCRAAEVAARAGDLTAAGALAERAAAGAADPRRALTVLEEIQRTRRDSTGRVATLERHLEAEERSEGPSAVASTLRELAAALLEAGRGAEAVGRLERALALGPDDPPTLRALADACLAAGQTARAATAYERWLELAPEAPAAARAAVALQLGELREREGLDRAALERYQEALRAGAEGPAAVRAWRAVAALHRRRGDHEATARALSDAANDPHTLEAPRERAAQLAAAADVLRRQLGAPGRARECLLRALELAPDLMPVLDALEALEAAEGAHAQVAAVLERKIAASSRHAERCKALWARLGELRAGPLADAAGAREAWRRALDLDPAFRPALLRLARDAAACGDDDAAEAHYRALAAEPPAGSEPVPREELLEPLAWLAERCHATGRAAEAERLCARALDLQPRGAAALALLDRILGEQGRHAELADVLRRRIDLALQSAEPGAVDRALELELRRGAILEQQLHRLPEAAAAYRHVLRLQPTHRGALVRLAALLRRERSWRELHGVLTRLADLTEQATDGGIDAIGLRLELAEVARDGLGDPVQAEVHLRRALALDPRSRAALDGLIGLHRDRGDFGALDELLVRRLALEEDAGAAVALGLERARLLTRAKRDGDALAVLRALPRDTAPDEALRLRADLCEATGAHREAAEVLEALRSRSQGRGDAATELAVARRLGAAASGRGHDRAAEEMWQRVLELAPDDDEAIRALAAIYRQRRDGQRYVAMVERRLAAARGRHEPAAAVAELLCEIARVQLEGGDLAGARRRLAECAAIAPEDRQVQRLAAEAAAAAGDFAAVADALSHLARPGDAAALDPAARADLLGELAGVAEERLGDQARAVAALGEAVALYPPGARRQSALRRLASLAFTSGRFDVAAGAYAQLDSRSPEDLARLAEAHERCGKLEEAAALWRELEQVGPLRARARARLVSLYRAAGAERELAAALERAAEDEAGDPDAGSRATAFAEAAALHLAAGDADSAARCARRALAIDSGSVDLQPLARALGGDVARVAEEVARLAHDAPRPRRAALHLAVAKLAEVAHHSDVLMGALTAAAEAEDEPRRRAALHLRRARLAREALQDPAAATAAVEAAFACDPADDAVLEEAANAAEQAGDPARAEELLARRAAGLTGRELRATLDRLAQLALRRGDAAAFERHLDAILALDPEDERALAALASLRRTSGDAAGAAELFARLSKLARGPGRRAELLLARGALLADRLHDLIGAYDCYVEAAACSPTPDTFACVASVAMDLGRFDAAAAALERRVELLPAEDDWARGETLARLGAVRRHQGRDHEARDAFRRAAAVLKAGTLWAEMLRRQVELALIAGDPADALSALRQLAENNGASSADLAQLAELKAALGSATTVVQPAPVPLPAAPSAPAAPPAPAPTADAVPEPAVSPRTTLRIESRPARQAVEPTPEPASSIDDAFAAPDDDAVPQAQVIPGTGPVHITAHDTRPVATIALLCRRVEEAAAANDDAALDAATLALWERLPGDALAFQHRRRLLAGRGEHAALAALIRERLRHAEQREERVDLRCEQARLLDQELGEPDGATQALESALSEMPDYPPALEALADLCYRGHDLPRARELYARLGDHGARLAPDALAFRRGELAEAANDRADARLLYLQAAETNPASLEAREALARLALVDGDRPGAIRWLKQVEGLLPLSQVTRRTDVRHQLAELHARAAEPGIARVYLELVLAENQDSASALELAAGVYAQLGQWELAARALERLSFVVESPDRRADLLYRRGEIYRRRLNDPERATDCYLKAVDLAPTHVPTLRRVVDHYWMQGDWASVAELGCDLAQLGPPLADPATFALRWGFATALATRDLSLAASRLGRVPLDAEQLRILLMHAAERAAAAGSPVEALDPLLALLTAVGGERSMGALVEELAHFLGTNPTSSACRRVLGRLLEQRGGARRARSHYAVCVFLHAQDPARARLEALGPAGAPAAEALAGMGPAVHPDVRGPLRRLFTLLSPALAAMRPGRPQLIGPPLDEASAPLPHASIEWLRQLLGVGALNVHWVGDTGVTVAVESSRPPRVLVSRAAASLPQPEFQFLVARGLELMRSGGLLLSRLKDEEVAATLSALMADFVPQDQPLTGLGRSFAEQLAAAGVRSATLPVPLRTQIAEDLESYFAGPTDLPAIRRGQECSADRIGLLACGDPLAALRARARLEGATDDAARAALLERSDALRELIGFATGAELEACYPPA